MELEKDTNIKEYYSYCFEDKFQMEDIENRHLYINSEIDDTIMDSIVYYILRFNLQDRGIPKEERKPIFVYINSPGGTVTDGFGVIDAIMQSETPVYTVNLATCYSMGFLIFLAGEKRFAMPNSTYLCHDGSSFAYGSTGKLKDRMEFETEQIEKHMKDYILSRTTIGEKLYDAQYRTEWYMYANCAKEYDIVTHIIGTDCKLDDIL